MKKINPPRYIYEELNIKNADFYNIDLANDNTVFLNPYEIELLDAPIAKKATAVAIDFFENVRSLLNNNYYLAAKKIFCNHLSEPSETCFGYSHSGVDGKGIKDMAEYVLENLYTKEALRNAITRIEDVKLFLPKISNDKVSDLYTNVIRQVLIDYTKEQCNIYGQKMQKMETLEFWDINRHQWMKLDNEEQFIWDVDQKRKLLVPKNFVRNDNYNINKFISMEILQHYIDNELAKSNSPLVYTLKNGTRKITKRAMRKELEKTEGPLDKMFAQKYAETCSNCVENFRNSLIEQRNKRKKIR